MAKARDPYTLRPVAGYLQDGAETTQDYVEEGIAKITSSLADDGIIDPSEAGQILSIFLRANKSNNTVLSVATLLHNGGLDLALAEVDRQQARRRGGL